MPSAKRREADKRQERLRHPGHESGALAGRTTLCMLGSRPPPEMSFTMWAPAAMASRATALWKVSTEMSCSRRPSFAAKALAVHECQRRCMNVRGGA